MSIIRTLFSIIISLIPTGYLLFIWSRVPATIPLHFGLDGRPDRYGANTTLLLISALMALTSIGIFAWVEYIYSSGKKGPYPPPKFIAIMGIAVVLIVAGTNLYAVVDCTGYKGTK